MNSLTDKFQQEVYAKTKKYQKIYGFEIGTGKMIHGIMSQMRSNMHICKQLLNLIGVVL